MPSPYQLPADLQAQPLGVSWSTIGAPGSTRPSPEQNLAALTNVCWTASGLAESDANQILRCTLRTERNNAPGSRCGVLESGVARFLCSQNPVLRVVNAQVAPAGVNNPSWTQLPLGAAYPSEDPYGVYNSTAPGMADGGGASVLINQGVGWWYGREGIRVQVQYLAGWPHTALTVSAAASATSLAVDDVTGWSGAVGWVSDGANTEIVACGLATANVAPAWVSTQNYFAGMTVSVSGSNFLCLIGNGPSLAPGIQEPTPSSSTSYWQANPEPTGPGTLQLVSPTNFSHTAPCLITTMPPQLRWAVALYGMAQALERGIATMSIPAAGGTTESSGGIEGAISQTMKEAAIAVRPFARIF